MATNETEQRPLDLENAGAEQEQEDLKRAAQTDKVVRGVNGSLAPAARKLRPLAGIIIIVILVLAALYMRQGMANRNKKTAKQAETAKVGIGPATTVEKGQRVEPCAIGFVLLGRISLGAKCGDGFVDFVGEFLRVVGVGSHGVRSSLWSWSSAFQPNAERHLAKAGGSKRKLRGLPTLVTEQGEVARAEVCTSGARKIGEAACGRVGAGTLAISLVGKARLFKAGV